MENTNSNIYIYVYRKKERERQGEHQKKSGGKVKGRSCVSRFFPYTSKVVLPKLQRRQSYVESVSASRSTTTTTTTTKKKKRIEQENTSATIYFSQLTKYKMLM